MPQHEFITKQLIDKGWSEDRKYCVTDEQGNKFLLRVSPIEQYDRKKSEYELMGQVAALGVPMCRPLEFGTFDEGVYSIQTWIDGIDAEENIHNLTNQEQYSYGFEAGKILKEIHKIPAPKEMNSTPFVRQYDILSNKWGVLLCQKEYQTNDIRRSSREWL